MQRDYYRIHDHNNVDLQDFVETLFNTSGDESYMQELLQDELERVISKMRDDDHFIFSVQFYNVPHPLKNLMTGFNVGFMRNSEFFTTVLMDHSSFDIDKGLLNIKNAVDKGVISKVTFDLIKSSKRSLGSDMNFLDYYRIQNIREVEYEQKLLRRYKLIYQKLKQFHLADPHVAWEILKMDHTPRPIRPMQTIIDLRNQRPRNYAPANVRPAKRRRRIHDVQNI